MKAMCANPKGTIGCAATHGECDSMRKMLVNTMPGATEDNLMGYVGVACEYNDKDCKKKESPEYWEKECSGAVETMKKFDEKGCLKADTDKSQCCEEAKAHKDCKGEDCLKMEFAMMTIAPKGKEELTNMLEISKA